MPTGLTVNLLPHPHTDIPTEHSEAPSCSYCGAILNPYARLDPSQKNWECCFCNRVTSVEASINLQETYGLKSNLVDYVTSSENYDPRQKSVVLFVLDTTFPPKDLKIVIEALKLGVCEMDGEVLVGLVLVDSCVSIVNLKATKEMVHVHCLPGHTINLPPTLRTPSGGFHSCIQPIHSALEAFNLALEGLTPRKEARCIGNGIHEALMVLRETREEPRKERIVLLTSGIPSHGPGSVPSSFIEEEDRHQEAKKNSIEFFERLADVAHGMGVTVDVYGLGMPPSGLTLIESLPKRTNGVWMIKKTVHAKLLSTHLVQSLTRTFGSHGIIDLRLSKGLRLSSIVGQVAERLTPGESGKRRLTQNACLLKTMEHGKSVSFFIEVTKDLDAVDLYLQVILSWKSRAGGLHVERVINLAIQPTGNIIEFMKSVHPISTSVLLAKKIMLKSIGMQGTTKMKKMVDLRNGLPYKMAYMAQKFGQVLESKKTGLFGFGLSQTWACPHGLWYISQSLYHLHKGELLGNGQSQHPDEIGYLQTTLLAAMDQLADRIIVPRMFQINQSTLELAEIPAITSLLASDQVLLLDHGFIIMVWIGSNVEDKEKVQRKESILATMLRRCEEYGVKKCEERGFLSEMKVVVEGYQDAADFYRHLTPSHKDSLTDQANQSSETINQDQNFEAIGLDQKSDASFYEWCREVNIEPSKVDQETFLQVAMP